MPISSYIEILWRRRRLLLMCVTVCVIYGVLNWHVNRTYESTGTVMYQKAAGGVLDKLSGGSSISSLGSPFLMRAEFDRLLTILKSKPFLELAAQRVNEHELRQQFIMDLEESKESQLFGGVFNSMDAGRSKDSVARIERGLAGMIIVSGSRNSIIEVGVKLRNPGTVQKLASVVQLAAVEFLTKKEMQELEESRAYLNRKRDEAEQNIKKIDDEFLAIDQSSEMVLTGGTGTAVGNSAIEGFQRAKVQLEENRRLIERIREQIKEKEKAFFSEKGFAAGPDELSREIDTLSTKRRSLIAEGFVPGSRQLEVVEEQLKLAQARYQAAQGQSISEVGNEAAFSYVNLTDKLKELSQENVFLSAKLEALHQIFKPEAGGGSPAGEVRKMSYLLKRAELQYTFYAELTRRLFDVDVRGIIVQNQFTILEAPSGATTVRRPALAKNLILALFFAFAVGVSLAFHMEQMNPLLVDGRDVEGMMVRILGYIPDLTPRWGRRRPKNWEKTLSLNLQRPDSREGLVFKHIRRRLLQFVEQEEKPVVRLVVTSSAPSEGKSFFSLNIALSLARFGKRVLLVDADLRARKLTRTLAPSSLQGFAGPSGRDMKREIVVKCCQDLDFLPAGVLPEDPTEYVASVEAAADLEAVGVGYDFVIVDTAPAILFPDAVSLARNSDAVVLVGCSGQTRLKEFGTVVQDFSELATPLWVVFNKAQGVISRSYTSYPSMGRAKPSSEQAA